MFINNKKKIIIILWREIVNTQKYNTINNFYEKANAMRLDKLYQEAVTNYLNAILIDRCNAESYLGLGICYKHLGKYAKAIKYLEIATQIQKDYYEAFYELGICHQLDGQNCGAIKNFIQAIQINPENPNAILQLGISHELCEEYDLALMIYQKLIENSTGFLKAYEQKAKLLMKLNRYKEAIIILGKVAKRNPEYYRTYVDIGICLEKLGKLIIAQRYYRKFLSHKPFSQDAQFVRGRLEKIRNRNFDSKHLNIV